MPGRCSPLSAPSCGADGDADRDRHRLHHDPTHHLAGVLLGGEPPDQEEHGGGQQESDPHLLHGVDRDLGPGGVGMKARVAVVAQQEDQRQQHVHQLAMRGHDEAGVPHLHGVEERQAEEQATGHAAAVLAQRLADGAARAGHPCPGHATMMARSGAPREGPHLTRH